MSKLSEFLARKTFAESPETVKQILKDLDSTAFAEGGSRLGAENEALRGLVIDAARKIEDLETLKVAFGRIIEPLHKTLQTLEQEKSHNASLIGALNESRAAAEALRLDLQRSEKSAASLSVAQQKLQYELEQARHALTGLETARIELANENAIKAEEIANLQSALAGEVADRQALGEQHRVVTEKAQTTGNRLGQLEIEIVAARQKIILLEDERQSLQSSLDQTVGEVSRLCRQLAETGNALTTTQARATQVDGMHAEAEAERVRLAAELDETKERHRAESSAQAMRLDALQSRAATAEKLLVEARTNLAARAEEVRSFDRRLVEATIARNAAEKKLIQLEGAQQNRERQISDLEQARTALLERNAALTKTIRGRETALAHAEEKIQASAEFVARLEADIHASRTRAEKRTEELNAMMERERMDRSVAEGALEATRKDNARLQREVASLETSLRRGPEVDKPELVPHAKRAKNGGKGTVQPIIKS